MNKPCGAVVRPPRRHGKVNAGASGRSVNADRPALLLRCPTPHSSPPNQCLPTDTSRPFCHIPQSIDTVAKKKKSSTPQREARRHRSAPLHRGFVLPEKIHPGTNTNLVLDGGWNSSGSKTYLSTQRRPWVEVVGYPQHPQDGETQQYPGLPPHGCRFRFGSAVGLIRGSAI